jgi:hypothetical protein
MVASPVDIEAEWRFFIAGKEVVGSSEYRRWEQPSAWNRASAFSIELLILERGVEIARRRLNGTPDIRTCLENGFLIAVDHHGMEVIDPSDASLVRSRSGWIAPPEVSGRQFYGLTDEGVIFSEPATWTH